MTAKLTYRRILLKISGEALMGSQEFGIDMKMVNRIAGEICSAIKNGSQIGLVIGGGNIFRGMAGAASGMERSSADYMGMLATIMNALAMQGALEKLCIEARVMSAIPMRVVCEPFTRARALRHLNKGRVVIFAGGTGNPYFTTDTAAALRAAEMGCDALLKGTQVDGVYSEDPKINPDALRFDKLGYSEVLSRNLRVMDASAIAIARDNKIPILVFSLRDEGALAKVLNDKGVYTKITG